MLIKRIIVFSSLSVIIPFFLISISFAQNNEEKCFCQFDKKDYKAKCDCALVCAVAVKDGKDCNIVCDGSPKSAINGDKYFEDKEKYLADMVQIREDIFKYKFKPFYDFKFAKKALPRLIRSAYIGADFIEKNKKVELDELIVFLFNEHNEVIVPSFSGEIKDGFEIDLSEKYKRKIIFTSSSKSIKLIDSGYDIKFSFVK